MIRGAGLDSAPWLTVDDTGTRHKAKNGHCTHIGNDHFAWPGTTASKSRHDFLDLLRVGHTDYAISDDVLAYIRKHALSAPVIRPRRPGAPPCRRTPRLCERNEPGPFARWLSRAGFFSPLAPPVKPPTSSSINRRAAKPIYPVQEVGIGALPQQCLNVHRIVGRWSSVAAQPVRRSPMAGRYGSCDERAASQLLPSIYTSACARRAPIENRNATIAKYACRSCVRTVPTWHGRTILRPAIRLSTARQDA